MYLAYGNYRHADNEAEYTISTSPVETDDGDLYASVTTWQISGQIHADTTAQLVTALRTLEAAYSTWDRDLVFYDDNGNVCHALRSAGSSSGVRVIGFGYPNGTGAQLSTFRDYTITVQAEYPVGATPYRSFRETLSFQGGGPERAVLEIVNGPPQEQILKSQTAFRAVQSGSAVGLYGYPPVPPPLFPGKERVQSVPPGNPQFGSPRVRQGRATDFPVSWSYEFWSATPMAGFPNRRPR